MGLIVQKYGGSSVADAAKIRGVARRVIGTAKAGHGVVVVVSAMGKTTDGLIRLAQKVTPTPPEREMDMLLATGEQVSIALLAMAIDAGGHKARSFTGEQAGIRTDAPTPGPGSSGSTATRSDTRSTTATSPSSPGFQGVTRGGRHHDARPGRLRSDRGGARRRACRPTSARSTPTWTASTPPIRTSSPRRRSSTGSPTTRCSRWRASAPRCSSPARSSSRRSTACRCTSGPRSSGSPARS